MHMFIYMVNVTIYLDPFTDTISRIYLLKGIYPLFIHPISIFGIMWLNMYIMYIALL